MFIKFRLGTSTSKTELTVIKCKITQFTSESELNASLSFLDVLVERVVDGGL